MSRCPRSSAGCGAAGPPCISLGRSQLGGSPVPSDAPASGASLGRGADVSGEKPGLPERIAETTQQQLELKSAADPSPEKERLFLLDGTALAYRAHFAFLRAN